MNRRRCGLVLLVLALTASARLVADDWPQWRGPTRDGVWRETGIVTKFASERLEPVWRAEIGSGYSGPTVADGRVYVTDRLVEPKQTERVHCFDARSGEQLWSYEYDCPYGDVGYQAGPRACVTLDEGRAFALGTMGHFHCFDALTGDVLWKKDLREEYSIRIPKWGLAAAPLVDGDLVILQIGGRGACLVAFDKQTGQQRWTALEDRTSYSAPIIIKQAGKRVLACWTGDSIVGVDPASGEVYWRHPFRPKEMVIAIATPVVDANRLFVTSFYDGAEMLKLSTETTAVESMWRRRGDNEQHTDALHSIMATPILDGDYLYGVDSYGELRCLEADTGDRVWEDQTATPRNRWSNIHMVRNGEHVWMFNERGELLISKLSPKGFEEISRTKLIDPTLDQLRRRDGVCWAHPAYAYRHVFVRNDKEIICTSLAATERE